MINLSTQQENPHFVRGWKNTGKISMLSQKPSKNYELKQSKP